MKAGDTELGMWTQATGLMMHQQIGSVAKKLGPQPIRHVWLGPMLSQTSPFVPKNSEIRTMSDAKGKRMPDIRGIDAHYYALAGIFAFAGFTWDDVKRVPINGYTRQYDALLEGRTDMAFGAFDSAAVQKQGASPKGIRWIELDPNDKEGWRRLHEVTPWMMPLYKEEGVGISPKNPVNGIGYPDTIFAYDHIDEDLIYAVVKALHEGYDDLKVIHKKLAGFTIDNALDLTPIEVYKIPYHPGAIKYFKEIGRWTPRHEELQQEALQIEKKRMTKAK
jgi:TRAP transporter TAXI family solute receptor